MTFEFATANRILFGPGKLAEAGGLAREMGSRALVVTGRNTGRAEKLLGVLENAGIGHAIFPTEGEPDTRTVERGARLGREAGCDFVIGFGGGGALDAAKAAAALVSNPGELLDYLEVIGRGQPLEKAPVPCMAIPTTSGTGSEVTRNAVLQSKEHQVKASLRSPLMLPRVALVDPELALSVPPEITAGTGLDALTQLIEPYVSSRANPMTDALALEGMRRVAGSLRRAWENGNDLAAREEMAVGSLFGGLALANAGLGAAHGFAAPIGGMFPAPHGAVCAALLPHVMAVNCRALERRKNTVGLRRYETVSRVLTGNPRASASDGVAWTRDLCRALRIPPLSSYGIKEEHMPVLVGKAAQASSMRANPVTLEPGELEDILRRAL